MSATQAWFFIGWLGGSLSAAIIAWLWFGPRGGVSPSDKERGE